MRNSCRMTIYTIHCSQSNMKPYANHIIAGSSNLSINFWFTKANIVKTFSLILLKKMTRSFMRCLTSHQRKRNDAFLKSSGSIKTLVNVSIRIEENKIITLWIIIKSKPRDSKLATTSGKISQQRNRTIANFLSSAMLRAVFETVS